MRRSAARLAYARFRSQPVRLVLDALAAIFDAHLQVVHNGFVSVDLYDGGFIYDFEQRIMRLCDLDEYRPGPFVVETDRLPGSGRFMAPEDWQRGATIDERTTVFHLGRCAQVLLASVDEPQTWRASTKLAAVAERATAPHPVERFSSVSDFVDHWQSTT
jgi:hypothetical protein